MDPTSHQCRHRGIPVSLVLPVRHSRDLEPRPFCRLLNLLRRELTTRSLYFPGSLFLLIRLDMLCHGVDFLFCTHVWLCVTSNGCRRVTVVVYL